MHFRIDTTKNSKCLSNMKASERGLELACDHGQHVLDKYDWDI